MRTTSFHQDRLKMARMNTLGTLGSWAFRQATQIAALYGRKYYPALAKLARPMPFSADIHVSTRCNSRCITCDYWRKATRNRYPARDLTFAEIEDLLSQMAELCIRVVGLGGAEPLIRKDIGRLIKSAKEITGGMVYLTTNGLLLESKAENLIENGIDHVSISIDGIGDTDDHIRGRPGSYEKAIRGIIKLQELIRAKKECKCICNIGTTIMNLNITELPRLHELAKRLGVHWNFNLLDGNIYFAKSVDLSQLFIRDTALVYRTFDYLADAANEIPEVFTLDPGSLAHARRYLKYNARYRHCYLGYFRLYIDSSLNVYPGCILLPPVGNVKNSRLKTIVGSRLYRERTEQMYKMECPGCTCGYLHNCMIEELPATARYLFRKMRTYRKYIQATR